VNNTRAAMTQNNLDEYIDNMEDNFTGTKYIMPTFTVEEMQELIDAEVRIQVSGLEAELM